MSESHVYNMDCMEFMKKVPDKFYDLACVDPPYGINVTGTPGGVTSSSSRSAERRTTIGGVSHSEARMTQIGGVLCSAETVPLVRRQCTTGERILR